MTFNAKVSRDYPPPYGLIVPENVRNMNYQYEDLVAGKISLAATALACRVGLQRSFAAPAPGVRM